MAAWLEQFWTGIVGNFGDLSDGTAAGVVVGRVLLAAALGGALGYERERRGKPDGMRTHAVIALAAALFVLIPHRCGATTADLTRVVQGLAAGVGFLGAGAILKPSSDGAIHGLTSAASVYFTTAIGVGAGLGQGMSATVGTAIVLVILTFFPRIQRGVEAKLGIPPVTTSHPEPPQKS